MDPRAPIPARETLDLLPEGVMVADATGRILEVNRALCGLLGFTREELLAMSPNDIVPPDEQEDTRETRLGFLESGRTVQSVAGRRLRKDGTSIPLEGTLGRLPDRPGEPARYIAVFHEVLPREAIAGDLRGREAFLRTILDNSQNGIWIIDNFGHAFYSNPAMAQMLGYTTDEFLALPIDRRVHPEEVDRIRAYTEARIAGREAPSQYRTRLLHRDGHTVWVDRSITVLRRGGRFFGILVEHRDVSAEVAREAAERAAYRAEIERLERLVDTFQSGIVITDTEGKATFVNRSMAAMLGYTVEEYRTLTAEQRIHPDDIGWVREMVLGRMRGEDQPDSYRVRMLHRDGRTVWMERRVSTLTADGRIVGALAENRDITEELERSAREAAAQQAETARLRRLLDTFQVGVTIRDNHGRTLFCNPAMAAMLGYSIEEFVARPLLDHVDPADRAMVNEFGERRARGLPAPERYRVRLRHRDGHVVWVSRSVSVLTGEHGFEGTLGENVDITAEVEREEREAAAQQAETARLRRILDNFRSGVAIYDLEGWPRFCNPAMVEMLGYSVEEFLSGQPFQHIHPDDREIVSTYAALRAAGEPVPDRYRVRMVRKDGTVIVVDRSATLVASPGEPPAVLVEHRDVTEEVRLAEREAAAQREETERLRALLDSFQSGIAIIHPDGRVLYCNPAMAEMTGYTPEEYLHLSIEERIHPLDVDRLRTMLHQRVAGVDLPNRYRARLRHRDGRPVWVERSSRRLSGAGWDGMILLENVDITARVLAEEREAAIQREERERIERILDTLQNGVWITDYNRNPVYANPAMAAMLGYTVEEFMALPPERRIHPDEIERNLEFGTRRREGGEAPSQYRTRLLHRDGHAVWVDRTVTTLTRDGRVEGLLVEHRDVSEAVAREAREAAEREAQTARLESLVAAAMAVNSAATVMDRLRILTEVARTIIPSHQSITSVIDPRDWSARHVVSLSERYAAWREWDLPLDGSGIYRRVMEENRTFRMTQAELEAHPAWRGFGAVRDLHPPMRGWLAAPLRGPGGTAIGIIQLSDRLEGDYTEADEALLSELATVASAAVAVAEALEVQRSLSERLAAEVEEATEQLRQRNEELQRVAQQRQEFLSTLSHELRTPLNVVLGYAQLLSAGQMGELNDDQREALEDVLVSSRHLASIISDLLDLGRIDAGRWDFLPEEHDPREIVERVVDGLRSLARPEVVVYAQVAAAPPSMTVDARSLRQVLTNIIGNAVKFTTHGEVAVRARAVAEGIEIAVRDTGPGIDPEELPHLFEPYWRSKGRTGEGTGLGLPITKRLVDAMGGRLEVESTPGEGAVFVVTLPLEPPAP